MLFTKIQSMLLKIFKPIVNLIKTKTIKPFKGFLRISAIIIVKSKAFIKAVLFPKKLTLKNYFHIRRLYVAKRLLGFIALFLIVAIYFLFINPPAFVYALTNRTPVLHEDTKKSADYTGQAKFYDTEDNIKYVGDFEDGLFTGKGKLYNTDGAVIYEGDFEKGEQNGTGQQYDDSGTLIYKGPFVN